MNPSPVTITDNAIPHLAFIKEEVIPLLRPHPVRQSDLRTKGLVVTFQKDTEEDAFAGLPVLYHFIKPHLANSIASYILAVNQTPPTRHDHFFMRPHIDRRWDNNGFGSDIPIRTSVMFLDFPPAAEGGELIVFEEVDQWGLQHLDKWGRENARTQLAGFKTAVVRPIPGRICTFPGHLPHAVLGYSSNENEAWRLSIVLAAFR